MMFTRPFLVGDHIRVDGAEGWVIEIGTFFTYINTMKHIRLAIPNKKILSGNILCNFSKLDVLQVDCKVSTSRTFSCSIERIENVLRNTARRVYKKYALDVKRNHSSSVRKDSEGFRLLHSQSDDFATATTENQDETTPWRNRLFGGSSQRGRPLRMIDEPIVRLLHIDDVALRWNIRIWCCNRDRKRVCICVVAFLFFFSVFTHMPFSQIRHELNVAVIEDLRKEKIPCPSLISLTSSLSPQRADA